MQSLYANKKERIYCLVGNANGRIVKMEQANLMGESLISIELSDYQFRLPAEIFITHKKVALDLELRFIKR